MKTVGNIPLLKAALVVSSGSTLEVRKPSGTSAESSKHLNLEDVERRHIIGVLQQTDWRLSGQGGAAEILGLKRTTLQSKMKKLNIQRPRNNALISAAFAEIQAN